MRLVQAPAATADLYLADDGRRTVVVADGTPLRVGVGSTARMTALVETADGWLAAGRRDKGDGSRLVLTGERHGRRERLRSPRSAARFQTRPVPLVARGALAAIAWLEGDDPFRLGVRAARRSADGWETPFEVSPAGERSQTGLAGAILADGSILLAWSRWDGTDDELVWSRGRRDRWSAPRPIDGGNRLPDVAPSLIAAGDGALLAWAQGVEAGDGFRVLLDRFDGQRWQGARELDGGGLWPGWVAAGDTPRLLVRSTSPFGWSVIEVDERGRPGRRARLARLAADRPVIVGADRRGVTLRFGEGELDHEAAWERGR